MADQVKVDIITVDAVNNLEELRQKIKDAKDNLSTLTSVARNTRPNYDR